MNAARERARHCGHCPGSHSGALGCAATATTRAGAWLLLEHPGPWGESAELTALPGPLAGAVAEAGRLGVRVQLIRRPGRRRRTPPLSVYAGWSLGPEVWIEGAELADPAEVAELDLAAVASGRRPGFGLEVSDPLFLVCAHGRRNACCARTGGPLARHLRTGFGDLVWETTHVGGDRYAANLVCLPHGLYYGDLGPTEASAAVEAYLKGSVVLDRFRGRGGLPEPAQAAEHYVRTHTGKLEIEAVTVESITGASAFHVVLDVSATRYQVAVEQSAAAHGCGPECNEGVRSYRVRDLTLLNEAALV